MTKVVDSLSSILAVLAAGCVMAMMLLICLDTGMRWFSGRSVAGAQEIIEQLMVAIVFLGMAYALRRGDHVAVKILTDALPPRIAAALRLLGMAAMIAVVAWMTWRTGWQAWRSFLAGELRFGLLQIPVWPARIAIPLGLTALILQALPGIARQIALLSGARAEPSSTTEPHAF